jgi:ferredoxin--NADP+ reductase
MKGDFRVAIVGAGPAGFYACEHLLKAGLEVDLYGALPTTFGLVRAGVAPNGGSPAPSSLSSTSL